ncbi:hypothetical protein PMHK_24440 [Pseudomonas sp. MHK4]|jgi:hypothetical protein
MGVGKTVYKGEVKTGVFAWFFAPQRNLCRSELAREGRKGAVFNLAARVIVNLHREQARSYRFLSAKLTQIDGI